MFKQISIGIYYPGKSLLHLLQARTKFLIMFWIVIFLTIANHHKWHFAPYIVLVAILLTGILLSGISPAHIWRRMWLLTLFTVLGNITSLFLPDESGVLLYKIHPLHIPYGTLNTTLILFLACMTIYCLLFVLPIPGRFFHSLRQSQFAKRSRLSLILLSLVALATLFLIRNTLASNIFNLGPFFITDTGVWLVTTGTSLFLGLYALSLLLTMTTTPMALIEGLTLLMTPLRWLRLPVEDFALMTLLGLRFFPTLVEEAELLVKAQTARGADFSHGTIRERIQGLSALFVPFLQGVLRRASDLAIALEARGYESKGHQTPIHETSFKMLDYAVLTVVALMTVGALFL